MTPAGPWSRRTADASPRTSAYRRVDPVPGGVALPPSRSTTPASSPAPPVDPTPIRGPDGASASPRRMPDVAGPSVPASWGMTFRTANSLPSPTSLMSAGALAAYEEEPTLGAIHMNLHDALLGAPTSDPAGRDPADVIRRATCGFLASRRKGVVQGWPRPPRNRSDRARCGPQDDRGPMTVRYSRIGMRARSIHSATIRLGTQHRNEMAT